MTEEKFPISNSVLFIPLHFIQVTRPKSKIISEKLHDCSRVTILIFFKGIKVCNSVIECLFGELAGNIWTVQYFVVENWIIKGKAKTDRVGALQFCTFINCILVTFLSILNHTLAFFTWSKFTKIAEVVSSHFLVENNSFWLISFSDQSVFKKGKTALAKIMELIFNRLAVPFD